MIKKQAATPSNLCTCIPRLNIDIIIDMAFSSVLGRYKYRTDTPLLFECLENRQLLAGFTLVTHGMQLSGDTPKWLGNTAAAILDRVGSSGSQYRLKIEENRSQQLSRWPGSPVLGSAASGEATFELDWAARSNDFLFTDFNASGKDSTADLIAYETLPNLIAPLAGGIDGIAFAQLPIHLIGHSRGASVVSELAKMLGQRGIWVDQVTFLDARPLLATDFSASSADADPFPQVYSNVIFSDGYWRSDGFGVGQIDGFHVDGTYSVELDQAVLAKGGYSGLISWQSSEHNDVHLWYHGTIDKSLSASNGDHTVPSHWYTAGMGPRDGIGFHFSRIAGGSRPTSGLNPQFGGIASRISIPAIERVGPQWPNAADVVLYSQAISSLSVLRGQFLYGDYDSSLSATLILDRNQNPYDQDFAATFPLGSKWATGDSVGTWEFGITPGTVAPGEYFVAIQVTDGTNTRYRYAPTKIVITSPSESELFVTSFLERAPSGIADGDWAKQEMLSRVPSASYGLADWGAENYWFQTPDGDVWTMWHGGAVHRLADGQHRWILTNLADAAGLADTLSFDPGSLSGVVTGWRAFSIQGIMNGRLFSLWWSPASSAGSYIAQDGTIQQGMSLGLNKNGWVLSSISNSLLDPAGTPTPSFFTFLPFTESQSNGRTSFRPGEPNLSPSNDGISVVLVSPDRQIWVASFSVSQRAIPGTREDLNGRWLLERLDTVPSVADLGYTPLIPNLLSRYWNLASIA